MLSPHAPRAGTWNGVPVAIKIAPSYKLAKAELAMQESILGATISHPNVVRAPRLHEQAACTASDQALKATYIAVHRACSENPDTML